MVEKTQKIRPVHSFRILYKLSLSAQLDLKTEPVQNVKCMKTFHDERLSRGRRCQNYSATANSPIVPAEKDRPHSFGLRSPDALPMSSEHDYKRIAKSFGLHSPDQLDHVDEQFRARILEDTQLYFDADLIGKGT